MTWKLEPHDGYMSDETPPIQIVDDTGKVVACNTTFYPTAIKAEHAATIVAAVNGRAELVDALEAMAKEFRQLDLPYGRHAYLLATTAITNAKATP